MCEDNIKKLYARPFCTPLGFEVLGADSCIVTDWRSDNRDVTQGDGFVAIRGARTDGHDFIPDAIKRGASIILAEKRKRDLVANLAEQNPDVCFVLVDESIHDFATIAKCYLASVKPLLVAITGSVGKTTTKELCLAVAHSQYNTYGTSGNRNTLIGNSLTIMSMTPNTEVLVLEFGTNHFGEIAEMCDYFTPDVAVLTEVAGAHLEEFKSCYGVLKEKASILNHKDKLKCVIYNKENEYLAEYFDKNFFTCPVYAVGKGGNCCVGDDVKLSISPQGTSCDYEINGQKVALESQLFGVQHTRNMALALSLGKFLEIDTEKIKNAIAEMPVLKGRGVIHTLKNNCFLIDEAYNSNPSSCGAAIDNLLLSSRSNESKFKTCAILGGMRELGSETQTLHQFIIDKLTSLDLVYLLGAEWQGCDTSKLKCVRLFASLEDLEEEVKKVQENLTDTILLVKGSNSYGLASIVNMIKERG